jgi:ribosomal protein S17
MQETKTILVEIRQTKRNPNLQKTGSSHTQMMARGRLIGREEGTSSSFSLKRKFTSNKGE